MNANTKAQALNVSQTARLGQLLHEATSGFKTRVIRKTGKGPTDEELAAFSAKVTPNIKASILKADAIHSTADRADRLAAVKATAATAGIKFTHRREVEFEEEVKAVQILDRHVTRETLEVVGVNATRGGQTIAFKYRLDANNNLSIDYVTAFCRADENFDPLIGMEESLKKFQSNYVLNTPVTHERFGEVKLAQLVASYKEAEETAKAFTASQIADDFPKIAETAA